MTDATDITDAAGGPTGEPVSFAAAMDELTALVDALESDALDVDHLVTRVGRATELVQWCRERLDGARFQVEEILVRVEQSDTAES